MTLLRLLLWLICLKHGTSQRSIKPLYIAVLCYHYLVSDSAIISGSFKQRDIISSNLPLFLDKNHIVHLQQAETI